jgi:putative sterol carrier protein
MSIQPATEAIRAKVGENSGLGATVKFDCGDDGVVYVDGASSPNSVSNDNNEADCTIALELDVLSDLIAGDLDPTAAFMQGKLKVDGDMSVAMRLGSIL